MIADDIYLALLGHHKKSAVEIEYSQFLTVVQMMKFDQVLGKRHLSLLSQPSLISHRRHAKSFLLQAKLAREPSRAALSIWYHIGNEDNVFPYEVKGDCVCGCEL